MFRNKMSIVMYLIVSLAIIGLTSQMITNLTGFLMSILLMLIIGVIVFVIFNKIAKNRAGGTSPEMKKYREAVKQSKAKYSKNENKTIQQPKKSKSVRRRRKRRPTHLRVIQGKKSNKKDDNDNRASF